VIQTDKINSLLPSIFGLFNYRPVMAATQERTPITMEELHSMMVSQSAQIAVLTAGRDEAVEESTRFKILLDKFESQSGVMNTAEYQFHLTRAESLFPALELLGDDKILISPQGPLLACGCYSRGTC
jgi:uncharacterized protein YlxP (DUF503 family)